MSGSPSLAGPDSSVVGVEAGATPVIAYNQCCICNVPNGQRIRPLFQLSAGGGALLPVQYFGLANRLWIKRATRPICVFVP